MEWDILPENFDSESDGEVVPLYDGPRLSYVSRAREEEEKAMEDDTEQDKESETILRRVVIPGAPENSKSVSYYRKRGGLSDLLPRDVVGYQLLSVFENKLSQISTDDSAKSRRQQVEHCLSFLMKKSGFKEINEQLLDTDLISEYFRRLKEDLVGDGNNTTSLKASSLKNEFVAFLKFLDFLSAQSCNPKTDFQCDEKHLEHAMKELRQMLRIC